MNFAFIKNKEHEVKFGAGPLLRCQASSYPDIYSIYTPAQTGVPEILVSFRQFEKQEIVSIGYVASLSYSYTLKSRVFIGARASLQNDTNADNITQYGIRIGRRV
ncbi:MAG: hypothetical protein ABIN97_03710 [Ginsengibacter sp.]